MDDELWCGVIENLAPCLVLEVGGVVLRPLLMFIPSNVPRQFMIRELKQWNCYQHRFFQLY